MGPFLGDFAAGSLIDFTWDTNDHNGASINPTVAGIVSVYKDDDIVQSVAGITDVRAFDGLVGLHNLQIDTTHAFYTTGHNYHVVLSACTIDGQVVNATLAEFSIENRYNVLDADQAFHLGAAIDNRTLGGMLAQLLNSKYQDRELVKAVADIPAQGITPGMVASGIIQYEIVKISLANPRNYAAPDFLYYNLWRYNANQEVVEVKASLGTVW